VTLAQLIEDLQELADNMRKCGIDPGLTAVVYEVDRGAGPGQTFEPVEAARMSAPRQQVILS